MNKFLLITGGAGYVGYTLTERMAAANPETKIVILDNFSKARIERFGPLLEQYKNIELIPWERGDIRDISQVRDVLARYAPKQLVHLAGLVDAFTTNREGKDRECMIVNYEAAVAVAEAAKDSGVEDFVFQSSVSIYSRGEDLTEESPKEPLSTYGKSKMMAEEGIYALRGNDFRAASLRSATIVGYNPSFRYETIINLMCARAVWGIETTLFESALDNDKSYLHLNDEASAIELLLQRMDIADGESYNARSFNTSLRPVLELIEKRLGPVNHRIAAQKTISQQVYTVNCDKLKTLGFAPVCTLEQTVNEILDGLLRQKEVSA